MTRRALSLLSFYQVQCHYNALHICADKKLNKNALLYLLVRQERAREVGWLEVVENAVNQQKSFVVKKFKKFVEIFFAGLFLCWL